MDEAGEAKQLTSRAEELARYRLCLQLDPKKLLYSSVLTREQLVSSSPENSPYKLIPGLLEVELAMKYHRHGKYLKAINLLTEAAVKGNGQAFYELSTWMTTCNFPEDRFIELADCLVDIDEKNGSFAIRLAIKAAKLGYAPAICHLIKDVPSVKNKIDHAWEAKIPLLMDHMSLGKFCVNDSVSLKHRKMALKQHCLQALYQNATAAERCGAIPVSIKCYKKAAKRRHLKSLAALGVLLSKQQDFKGARRSFLEAAAQGCMKSLLYAISLIQIRNMKAGWGFAAKAMVSGLEISQVSLTKSRCYNLITNRLAMVFSQAHNSKKKDVTHHLRELYWYGFYFSQANRRHDEELDLECRRVYSQTLKARQDAFYAIMGVYKRRRDIPRDILRLIAKKMLAGRVCPNEWGVSLIPIPEAIVESLKKDLANWEARITSYRKLDSLMKICLEHRERCNCHREIAHSHVRMIVAAWKVSLKLL